MPSNVDPMVLQRGLKYFKLADIANRSEATDVQLAGIAKSVRSAMAKRIIERLKELE